MPDFLEYTIGDWLDHIAENYPDNDGLIFCERGLRLTYRQLNEEARLAARGLLAMGIRPGDHVAIWATNRPEWTITMLACAKIGAVLVTVNTNYKIFELEYLLRQSDSMTLLYCDGIKGSNYHNILGDLIPELNHVAPGQWASDRVPVLKNIIYLPRGDEKTPLSGVSDWAGLMAMGRDFPEAELDKIQKTIDVHDVVNMQYTSGTTGFPKGVMLTHHNILNNGYFVGECMKFTDKDRLCIPVPFFHCFGLVLAQMACLTHASAMIPVDVYSPTTVLETVQAERCTALHGVPTMFIFTLDHPEFSKYDISSLRTGIMAGSTCPIDVMCRVIDVMHMPEIVITYGQTESSPGMTMSQTDDPIELRVTTVGRLLPHTEGKIVDPETNEICTPGTPGEICTRGYHIMKGYYNMPEATATAIDAEGWLHTGDIGICDENGYYSITGRIKDMIIRGGENIYPREIEELVYTHSDVQDVQVVGIPSKKFGEEVCAFVIAKAGTSPTEESIKAFVSANMSRHKIPSSVLFIDAFPMTASGKIQKYKLREHACEVLHIES